MPSMMKIVESGGGMKRSRFLGWTLAAGLLAASPAAADDISNNFAAQVSQTSLDALAQDLGALMGGGSFHRGEALGFPLGFDVGANVPVVGVQKDDTILRDDGSTAHALWGQAELGLPGRIGLIARAGKLLDGNLWGGGLSWGLIKAPTPGLPSVSVSALYSALDHDFLDASTLSGNAIVSIDFPFIHPYVGAGYDYTKLDPKSAAFVGAPVGTSTSLDATSSGYRVEAGVNLSVIPFTYLTLGAGLANGEALYHGGAGIQF
jgi:hypothetical protein